MFAPPELYCIRFSNGTAAWWHKGKEAYEYMQANSEAGMVSYAYKWQYGESMKYDLIPSFMAKRDRD